MTHGRSSPASSPTNSRASTASRTRANSRSLEKLTHLDQTQLATAALLRERIDYLVRSYPEEKGGVAAAVERLAREQAFTFVNRLAAIRMAEKRGLIVESVGRGYESKGFKVFSTVAGAGLGETHHRYRRYLYCLFDELAVDLGVLFDRRSPHGLLFPRENALLKFFDLINAPDLEALWGEDETIGWIYQYYNDRRRAEEDARPVGGPAQLARAGRPQPVLHSALRCRIPHRQHTRPHLV